MGPDAILRSLLLFNLLFALQLGLDGAFLWGGIGLPEGLTYAAYAHRGAYPLVVTALLAGAFVLVIRRPGAPAASRLVTVLALMFTGQNVLLMGSSLRRLALYVETYSLTQWRIAALVWMLIVALSLALLMLQIARRQDNRWLLTRVAAASAAVLYGCCFLDVPFVIASYNVEHCAETQGFGPALDIETVSSLGPDAIPAFDRYLMNRIPEERRRWLEGWRANAIEAVQTRAADWRAWTFRAWRLERYLDKRSATEPARAAADRTGNDNPQAP